DTHRDQQGADDDEAVEVQRRRLQPVRDTGADAAADVAERLLLVGAHHLGGASSILRRLSTGILSSVPAAGPASVAAGLLHGHARSPGSRVTAAANRSPRSA